MSTVTRVGNLKEVTPYTTFVITEDGFLNVEVFAEAEILGMKVMIHNDIYPENGIAITDPHSRFKMSHDITTSANKNVESVLSRVIEKAEAAFKNKKGFQEKSEACFNSVRDRLIQKINSSHSLALEVCVLF